MDKVNKIAFLDRDGVLNYEIGNYVTKLEDFKILPHAIKNCKLLKQKGYHLVLITNQGGIAKHMYTEADLKSFHQVLIDAFSSNGLEFIDLHYCPHHSVVENCLCRKPKGLMIEKVLHKYHLNADDCFMIGDHERDVEAAHAAGLKRAYEITSNEDWEYLLKSEIN